jgi:hypothetical protein
MYIFLYSNMIIIGDFDASRGKWLNLSKVGYSKKQPLVFLSILYTWQKTNFNICYDIYVKEGLFGIHTPRYHFTNMYARAIPIPIHISVSQSV